MTDMPVAEKLERQFREILVQRMADVPVVNEKLAVRAIGFHRWNGWWLGVLVTPWFMNLVLLPEEEPLADYRVGDTRCFTFPSGRYEFVVGYEEMIGPYLSCSLFSPMFEFDSQAAAEKTAAAALAALMDEENFDTASQSRDGEILEAWQGGPAKAEEPPCKPLKERIAEPMSRRAFLRGGLFSATADREP